MIFFENFLNAKQIVDFLFVTKKIAENDDSTDSDLGLFDDFDAVYIYIRNKNGNEFIPVTSAIKTNENYGYIKWSQVKNDVFGFIEKYIDNMSYSILDIRLRAPIYMYNSILNYNKVGEYICFDINFHINSNNIYISTSSVEKKMPVAFVEPSMIWDNLVKKNIENWQSSIKKT